MMHARYGLRSRSVLRSPVAQSNCPIEYTFQHPRPRSASCPLALTDSHFLACFDALPSWSWHSHSHVRSTSPTTMANDHPGDIPSNLTMVELSPSILALPASLLWFRRSNSQRVPFRLVRCWHSIMRPPTTLENAIHGCVPWST